MRLKKLIINKITNLIRSQKMSNQKKGVKQFTDPYVLSVRIQLPMKFLFSTMDNGLENVNDKGNFVF